MQRAWRRSGIITMILIAWAALGRSAAFARDNDGSWEYGAFVMSSKYDNSSHLATAMGAGLRIGYHFKAAKELELDVDRVSGDNTDDDTLRMHQTKYTLNYLNNYILKKNERMTPFITFGVGKIHVDNGTDSITRTLLRAGGGTKIWLTPHVGVRIDVEMFRWRGSPPVTPRPSFFSFDATLGMSFLFGGAK